MKSVEEWLSAYGVDHQNKTNQLIHKFCVPLIMFSLLGLLWEIPLPSTLNFPIFINVGTIFSTFIIAYYLALDIVYAFMMLFVCLTMFSIIRVIDDTDKEVIIYVFVFILSWIGQFIGHKIEGKKPSFIEDLQFLLIGPLWVLKDIRKKIK